MRIDVVYVSIEKDKKCLEISIKYSRKNIKNIGEIYVVSKNKLTNEAIWVPESIFPFSKEDFRDLLKIKKREGWYFQQMLKYYSLFKIKNISENVLILCSDSIFLKETTFIKNNKFLFNVFKEVKNHKPYFDHTQKLLPGIKKYQKYNGVVHHMIMNKTILKEMFDKVEVQGIPFWKQYCLKVNKKDREFSGAAEYFTYFNYIFYFHESRCVIRELKWFDKGIFLNKFHLFIYKLLDCDGVSFHSYNVKNKSMKRDIRWLILLMKNYNKPSFF